MKNALSLCCLLLIAGCSLAQDLHPAKDNAACLYGLKNAAGEWVIPARFTSIREASRDYHEYFETILDGKVGLLDKTGAEIFPPAFGRLKVLSDSLFAFAKTPTAGLGVCNREGQELIAPNWIGISIISKDYLRLENEQGYTFASIDGTVHPTIYPSLETATHNRGVAYYKGR